MKGAACHLMIGFLLLVGLLTAAPESSALDSPNGTMALGSYRTSLTNHADPNSPNTMKFELGYFFPGHAIFISTKLPAIPETQFEGHPVLRLFEEPLPGGVPPGPSGVPPGQGGVPPGQAKKPPKPSKPPPGHAPPPGSSVPVEVAFTSGGTGKIEYIVQSGPDGSLTTPKRLVLYAGCFESDPCGGVIGIQPGFGQYRNRQVFELGTFTPGTTVQIGTRRTPWLADAHNNFTGTFERNQLFLFDAATNTQVAAYFDTNVIPPGDPAPVPGAIIVYNVPHTQRLRLITDCYPLGSSCLGQLDMRYAFDSNGSVRTQPGLLLHNKAPGGTGTVNGPTFLVNNYNLVTGEDMYGQFHGCSDASITHLQGMNRLRGGYLGEQYNWGLVTAASDADIHPFRMGSQPSHSNAAWNMALNDFACLGDMPPDMPVKLCPSAASSKDFTVNSINMTQPYDTLPLSPWAGCTDLAGSEVCRTHAGGFQQAGRYLFIGAEVNNIGGPGGAFHDVPNVSEVVVLDIADSPAVPKKLYSIPRPYPEADPLGDSRVNQRGKAGIIGVARLPDGKYLMSVGQYGSDNIDFYVKEPDPFNMYADIGENTQNPWKFVKQLEKDTDDFPYDGAGLESGTLVTTKGPPSEGDALYFIGTTGDVAGGNDKAVVFQVHYSPREFTPGPWGYGDVFMTGSASEGPQNIIDFNCNMGNGEKCRFAAASGIYISPDEDNIYLYSTEQCEDEVSKHIQFKQF